MINEDSERLRKTTIAFLKDFADKGYENAVECIDWLEKQGELVNSLSKELDNAHERIDGLIQKNNELCIKIENQCEQKSAKQPHSCELEEEIEEWFEREVFPEEAYITPLSKVIEIVKKTANHFYDFGRKQQAVRNIQCTNSQVITTETCINEGQKKGIQIVLDNLQEYGLQNFTDEVKPKFKVDDWIIYKDSIWKVCNVSLLNYYELLKINNEVSTRRIEDVDKNARLWTIQDAKNGDVLADKIGIILFRKIGNEKFEGVVAHHCSFNKRWKFEIPEKFGYWGKAEDEQLHPATKEQRDTLMKAITDAGYEWNAEKLELRKIEAEAEELTEQKITGWSKEDSPYYDDICEILINLICSETSNVNKDVVQEDLNWLNSLKDRYTWKPSDEQMNTLDQWLKDNQYKGYARYCYPIINSLYQDLKKLKAQKGK
jgi:hypothetical protein